MDKRVSLKTVIAKVYRDLGENRELNFDDCVEWIGEALIYIGVFRQFDQKIIKLDVENGRHALPCDFYKLAYVTYKNIPLSWASNSMDLAYFCEDCKIPECCTDYSFYINDNFIFTSFSSGEICLEYLAIPTDKEGYPMIPDDIYFLDACKMYIIKNLDWQDWRRGVITREIKEDSEMRWNEKVQAARGAGNALNLHQLENMKNIMQRILPLNDEFWKGFKNLNKQERKYEQ